MKTSTAHPVCKVCGGPTDYLCDTLNEHSETRDLHHYRCRVCGLVFVGQEFSNEELGRAYGTCDMSAYYAETEQEARRKMMYSAEDLERHGVAKASSIVDVGTGNGMFIRALQERGFTRLACHEIPGGDLSALASQGCKVYQDFDYSSLPADAFDVVTLLDVAEHVRNPAELFRACHRILKAGGRLYLHTPVVTRLDRCLHAALRVRPLAGLGRAWQRGRTSIFHLQNYTPAALRRVLAESGFAAPEIVTVNELSWPVSRYVRVYLCEKCGWPSFWAPVLTPLFYPWLATRLFNANKAVVWALKPERMA